MSIAHKLTAAINNHAHRQRMAFETRSAKQLTLCQREMLNFSSNDYLGLAADSRVKLALSKGADEFGFGSGSSAMICGYSRAHQELEENFAAFLGRKRAIFFNSGYHANLGVITTFANRNTTVIADKHSHASIIDAIILSRTKHHRFRHQDLQHAEQLLQLSNNSKFLITETVFSMSGSITHTDEMTRLAKQYHAELILDDAHGFGVLGENGRGVIEHFNLSNQDIPLLITPLGKALGGVGAMVSGEQDTMEYLLQNARSYRYSTALPPAVCRANLRALQIIINEPWRITHLKYLSNFFNQAAAERNLTLVSQSLTPIKGLLTHSNEKTILAQERLISHGIFTAAIRPPTVPTNSGRLRISLNIHHTEDDIIRLLDLLAEDHDTRSP